MDDTFTRARGAGALLFGEDFDRPTTRAEPEALEPVFSATDLETARNVAGQESRDAAMVEFGTSNKAIACRALTAIAEQVAAARAEVASISEQSAEAVTRLLLDCFATAFPALSARHGAEEAAALLRGILPALHREPKITVRISPHIAAEMTAEIQSMDPDLAARVRLIPTDALTADEVRVAWENGTAMRDPQALWRQIEDILAPAGLLTTIAPLTQGSTAKEHTLVE
ncbi:MAG: hypothetical protein EXR07_10630 [Acetobacteraceae bacterium]|nr:hypothetical protein [Acetobacteraceae bacterium]